jgi:hypothetical protein
MPEHKGIDIREVWNFRLSRGVPQIDRSSGTWVVKIFAKDNPDYDPSKPETIAQPLEVHDTGIIAVEGDQYDPSKVIPCFDWLRSVRDKYSLPHIEMRKPVVAMIEEANAEADRLNVEFHKAVADNNKEKALTMKVALNEHVSVANNKIKLASHQLKKDIEAAEVVQ